MLVPLLSALVRQYFRYGFWKGKMLQRYPDTIRWRQLLTPFVCPQPAFFRSSFDIYSAYVRLYWRSN